MSARCSKSQWPSSKKMEQDRIKFEAELSTSQQPQSSQFQANLMKQKQLFQAELLKKLFEKKDY